MKYTIEGFSQEGLMECGLDCVDACLLRFIVDFIGSGKMEQHLWDDLPYYWIKYNYMLEQMPILGLGSPDALARRLRGLVAAGVVLHKTRRDASGTRSYYRLSDRGATLLYSREGTTPESVAPRPQSRSIDSSISDSSITRSSTSPSEPSEPPPQALPKPTKATRDPRVKLLTEYYEKAYTERTGFPPSVNYGTWGAIFKRLLRQSSQQTIEAVIDGFMGYSKRTRFSVYDFERSFDNVYGYLFDKEQKEARREDGRRG